MSIIRMRRPSECMGFFSTKLELAMTERGLSASDVATQVDCCYEHIRKMLRCQTLPSPLLLRKLCEVLRINHTEARRLTRWDYCRARYGSVFWSAQGLNPEHDELHVLWYFLTEEQRDFFWTQMEALARTNK